MKHPHLELDERLRRPRDWTFLSDVVLCVLALLAMIALCSAPLWLGWLK